MSENKLISRLLVADDRRLTTTAIWAAIVVTVSWLILKQSVNDNTWIHDFFFKRSFVQWVLLSAFAIGLIHVLRRVTVLWRERRALRGLHPSGLTPDTLVGRRWLQIQAACKENGRKNIGQYAKTLAEHDEAEIDAAYRISGDIVQILPLIGFFGTVFGLSIGLHKSFLMEGGATTKAFAQAIAIAFDNTLLGLALTIILFAVQSLLRKREEAVLLQLNLQANDAVAAAIQEPVQDPLQLAMDNLRKAAVTVVGELNERLSKVEMLLDTPGAGIKELVKSATAEVAQTVLTDMAARQKNDHDQLVQAAAAQLQAQSDKLMDIVSERTLAFAQQLDPLRADVGNIKTALNSLYAAAYSMNTMCPQLKEELCSAVKTLGDALAQRDALMPERLAAALAQRDSVVLKGMRGSLEDHSRDLRKEIQKPRTIKFVEVPHLPDGDGDSPQP